MMNKIGLIIKYLVRRYSPGRMVTVFPDDVFVVSYPKSGNTWVRFLIGNIYHQDGPVDFSNIEQKVPDIYTNSDADLAKIKRPRILKSHEYLDPRYKKVIYVVRDPRDVAVSYYHHAIKFDDIAEDYPMSKFVTRFIDGEIDTYGTWYENVSSWLHTRGGTDNFLMLRYEDLLDNTRHVLHKVAKFLELNLDNDVLNSAIEHCSMENMQRLEQKQSHLWNSTRKTRKDKSFVRIGKSDGWKSDLPAASARSIEEKWGSLMSELGYR